MKALRCDVCGRVMEVVSTYVPRGFSWRCPNQGFLRHFERERASGVGGNQ